MNFCATPRLEVAALLAAAFVIFGIGFWLAGSKNKFIEYSGFALFAVAAFVVVVDTGVVMTANGFPYTASNAEWHLADKICLNHYNKHVMYISMRGYAKCDSKHHIFYEIGQP